jgi:hypothetical protein
MDGHQINKLTGPALDIYTYDEDMKWYNLRLRKIVEMFRPEWAPDNAVNGDDRGAAILHVANQDPPTPTDQGDGDLVDHQDPFSPFAV